MADIFKILGQSAPSAASLTDAYTAGNTGICKKVHVCNRSSTATSFRISMAVGGAADATKQYIAYDVPIAGNEAIPFPVDTGFASGDVIRVYATLATLSFNIVGMESS